MTRLTTDQEKWVQFLYGLRNRWTTGSPSCLLNMSPSGHLGSIPNASAMYEQVTKAEFESFLADFPEFVAEPTFDWDRPARWNYWYGDELIAYKYDDYDNESFAIYYINEMTNDMDRAPDYASMLDCSTCGQHMGIENNSCPEHLALKYRAQVKQLQEDLKVLHRNCDPCDMTVEDHLVWEKWNRVINPENYDEKVI